MSKTKLKNLTTFVNSTKSSYENNFENSSQSFNNSSFNLTSSTNSNISSGRKPKNPISLRKKRQMNIQSNINKESGSIENSSIDLDFSKASKMLPSSYFININQDGFRNMDKANHINNEDIENRKLELQLRPISGLRNHIKRNQLLEIDLIRDTDFIERVGSIKTLKRLDLSFNKLENYPRQLCDLKLLESLNLTANELSDNDLPNELERYQNLIELILDKNKFKRIPKTILKLRKLLRLSLNNNKLIDLKNIENFEHLKYLTVDDNCLISIDDSLCQIEKLEVLYLSNNSIQTINSSLFKSNLYNLKLLDLSFNKLENITTEMLMLPHLESLNLSNNMLIQLPSLPATFFRAQPLFRFDLSNNRLCRFYDYLLKITEHLDLSSNRIKQIPSKAVLKLTEKQVNSKSLKIDNNILVEPNQEICNNGLKAIKEYFDVEHEKLTLYKGFKILVLGEPKSGKTSFCFALEDFNTQSNLIEQFHEDEKKESKLIEIYKFYMNSEMDETRPISSAHSTKSFVQESKLITSARSVRILTPKKVKQFEELNAFSNHSFYDMEPINSASELAIKKNVMPITIYDFNGSLNQFGHLSNLYLDKKALVIFCFDSTVLINSQDRFVIRLNDFLDHLFLKMSKNSSFSIIPILTKIDECPAESRHALCELVDQLINQHLDKRLKQIKDDLKEIEKLPQINASQSDRLKQLAQTQGNLNPDLYQNCLPISSLKMEGIPQINKIIKQFVYNNKKTFGTVNQKIPSFWLEIEKFATNSLSENPHLKYYDDKIKIISSNSISILCIDYVEYRSKIVEKYGMSHLVEPITDYLSSSGTIIWLNETEKLKKKVFLKPEILFEMLFVLYRCNFAENFLDVHKQSVRSKILQDSINMSPECIEILSNDYLLKGSLHVDLLKMLWYPIMITDSQNLLNEVVVMLAEMFHLFYPNVSREKLKILFSTIKTDFEQTINESIYSSFYVSPATKNLKQETVNFSSVIVPFYLPYISEKTHLFKLRRHLQNECSNAIKNALSAGIKNSSPVFMPRISQKYTFPWTLKPGVFEKFSVNCLLNSDLYYKNHYKNVILGYNEENSVGVIIYTNSMKNEDECNEVVFDFYLVSYQSVIDGLDPINNNDFEQTSEMDMDQIWLVALKVLQLFEETIIHTFPSLRFDRWSLCPECEKYTFYGEWITPKELQKVKSKDCPQCEKNVHYSFLVRPSTGQSLTLDMKRMQQRLERLARFDSKFNLLNTSSYTDHKSLNSATMMPKIGSPKI